MFKFVLSVSPGAGTDSSAREKVEQDFARAVESMRRVYTVSQVFMRRVYTVSQVFMRRVYTVPGIYA